MNTESLSLKTYNKFMKSPARIQLTGVDSSPSLPVPILVDGKPYFCFLSFIGKRLRKEEKIKIYRPYSKFVVKFGTGKIVNYVDYTFEDEFLNTDWETPIGEFPHDSIAEFTRKKYSEMRYSLISQYDKVVKDLQTGPMKKADREFRDQFFSLCEPSLIPFLAKIGRSFFEYLGV